MVMHELVIDGTPTGAVKDFGGLTPSDFTGHSTKSGWQWLPIVKSIAPLGADEVLTPVVKSVVAGEVRYTQTARPLTQQELDDRDRSRLRDAVADAILVEVRLVQWILANTAMTATDFNPPVRQAFQDLVPIADRLDP